VAEFQDRWPEAVVASLLINRSYTPELLEVRGRDGCRMYGMPVAGADHHGLWRSMRSTCAPHGWWPVLTSADPEKVANGPRFVDQSSQQVLAEAEAYPPGSIFDEMIDCQGPLFDFGNWWDGLVDEVPSVAALAEHIDDRGPVGFRNAIATDMDRWVGWLYLVPMAGHDIPALLGLPGTPNWDWHEWQGRTGQLSLADHVRVLRSWHQRYGADLVFASFNALLLAVRHPPVDSVDVARVALEQYGYCYDLDQYIGNVDDVARNQVRTDRWYFWWD